MEDAEKGVETYDINTGVGKGGFFFCIQHDTYISDYFQ